jgi:hypothetical protein
MYYELRGRRKISIEIRRRRSSIEREEEDEVLLRGGRRIYSNIERKKK